MLLLFFLVAPKFSKILTLSDSSCAYQGGGGGGNHRRGILYHFPALNFEKQKIRKRNRDVCHPPGPPSPILDHRSPLLYFFFYYKPPTAKSHPPLAFQPSVRLGSFLLHFAVPNTKTLPVKAWNQNSQMRASDRWIITFFTFFKRPISHTLTN